MTDDRCKIPRCRQEPSVSYLGHRLCREHWTRLAEAESGSNHESELLAEIMLSRNVLQDAAPFLTEVVTCQTN